LQCRRQFPNSGCLHPVSESGKGELQRSRHFFFGWNQRGIIRGTEIAVDPVPSTQITALLRAWRGGDQGARDQLVPVVYPELRRLAQRYMRRERSGHTLQTTALVNEAYLRLVDISGVTWQDRAHFFAVSAQIMRRILVDSARARITAKRGSGTPRVNLDEVPDVSSVRAGELTAIDEALTRLAQVDARKAQVIELRFFGGLSVEETAEVLKISPQSVMRDWKLAKAWLLRELSGRS
jgi:RNA polymerase sigma factor (TIGR02999 family)